MDACKLCGIRGAQCGFLRIVGSFGCFTALHGFDLLIFLLGILLLMELLKAHMLLFLCSAFLFLHPKLTQPLNRAQTPSAQTDSTDDEQQDHSCQKQA